MLNQQNWVFSHYKKANLIAKISIVADWHEKNSEMSQLYSLCVIDDQYQEFFLKDFLELEQAIIYANQSYHGWEFINTQLTSADGSSCSSCQAH
jgi:hypothetical protein